MCRLGLNCISSPLVPHDPPRKTNKNRSRCFAGRSASGRVSPTALTPCTARPAHAGGPCKAPFARRQEAVVACSMRGQFVGYRNRVTVTRPHARRRAHAPSCHSDVPAGPTTPGHDPSRRSVPGGTSPPRCRPLAHLLSRHCSVDPPNVISKVLLSKHVLSSNCRKSQGKRTVYSCVWLTPVGGEAAPDAGRRAVPAPGGCRLPGRHAPAEAQLPDQRLLVGPAPAALQGRPGGEPPEGQPRRAGTAPCDGAPRGPQTMAIGRLNASVFFSLLGICLVPFAFFSLFLSFFFFIGRLYL